MAVKVQRSVRIKSKQNEAKAQKLTLNIRIRESICMNGKWQKQSKGKKKIKGSVRGSDAVRNEKNHNECKVKTIWYQPTVVPRTKAAAKIYASAAPDFFRWKRLRVRDLLRPRDFLPDVPAWRPRERSLGSSSDMYLSL